MAGAIEFFFPLFFKMGMRVSTALVCHEEGTCQGPWSGVYTLSQVKHIPYPSMGWARTGKGVRVARPRLDMAFFWIRGSASGVSQEEGDNDLTTAIPATSSESRGPNSPTLDWMVVRAAGAIL